MAPRTIERGLLRDVQCRHPSLQSGFLDPQTAHEGKYEEGKEETMQRREIGWDYIGAQRAAEWGGIGLNHSVDPINLQPMKNQNQVAVF